MGSGEHVLGGVEAICPFIEVMDRHVEVRRALSSPLEEDAWGLCASGAWASGLEGDDKVVGVVEGRFGGLRDWEGEEA